MIAAPVPGSADLIRHLPAPVGLTPPPWSRAADAADEGAVYVAAHGAGAAPSIAAAPAPAKRVETDAATEAATRIAPEPRTAKAQTARPAPTTPEAARPALPAPREAQRAAKLPSAKASALLDADFLHAASEEAALLAALAALAALGDLDSAEGPQAGGAEGPQAARAEGPQAARAEGPQAARAEGPQAGGAEGPQTARTTPDAAFGEGARGGAHDAPHAAAPANAAEGAPADVLEDDAFEDASFFSVPAPSRRAGAEAKAAPAIPLAILPPPGPSAPARPCA